MTKTELSDIVRDYVIIGDRQKILGGKVRRLRNRLELVRRDGECIHVSYFDKDKLNLRVIEEDSHTEYHVNPDSFMGTSYFHPKIQTLRPLYRFYNEFLG